jgi:hypothetical protein
MNYKSLKSIVFSLVVAFMVIGFHSCSQDDEFSPETVKTRALVTIPANTVISANTTWSSANEYLLAGKVWVSNGATLTIQAGTLIRGAYNSNPVNASALIITRGSRLVADGNANNPIIMTAEASHQVKGGWGGLVILGNAQINQTPNQLIEGISTGSVPSGVDATYGTNVTTYNNEDSGVLRYVRVEYAGAAISPANELNAFTFGGVGSGTTVEYCQAYYGADDAFEFFGGRVNAKYLIATACDDDAFDFDFGYQGKIQFAVATIDPNAAYSSDPNGIECDNNGSGSGATPFTHPVLSNLTIVGTSNGQIAGGGNPTGYLHNGARFRRNTQYTLVNSIVYGYPTGVWNNTANSHRFQYNVVWGVTTAYLDFPAGEPDGTNNTVANANSIVLTAPFGNYYNSPALVPTGNPALSGANFTGLDMSFFTTTTYKGAVPPSGLKWLLLAWIRG